MPQKSLYGKQVHTVLIQMGAKSMAEGMAGKPVLPPQPVFVGMDMPGEEKGINGPVLPVLFREKKAFGPAVFKPVPGEQAEGDVGKNGVTVIPVFAVCDMEAHIFTLHIFIAQPAQFPDAQAGGIHDGGHGFLLQVRHGGNKLPCLLF